MFQLIKYYKGFSIASTWQINDVLSNQFEEIPIKKARFPGLVLKLVEAAGIEPASENPPL